LTIGMRFKPSEKRIFRNDKQLTALENHLVAIQLIDGSKILGSLAGSDEDNIYVFESSENFILDIPKEIIGRMIISVRKGDDTSDGKRKKAKPKSGKRGKRI